MTPTFEIFADGNRVTPIFADRLISLDIRDESGERSDEVTLTIEDSLHQIESPAKGAQLEIHLGYKGTPLRNMGIFIVDDIEYSGPPSQIKIHAAGCPFTASRAYKALQSQKTRSWEEGTTIADLVTTIAEEHGLEPTVSDSLAATTLPHTDQTEESDINLLTRIAKNYSAIAKPTFGRLTFLEDSTGKTKSGANLPTVNLTINDLTRWRAVAADRARFNSVTARWHNYDTGQP